MSSQFAHGEIRDIVIAWVVLSVGISFAAVLDLLGGGDITANLDQMVAAFVATATGFICHEMGHKFVAIRHGYVAHFRLWTWGIILTLVTAIAFRGNGLFGAPGAVYIAPAAAAGYYGYGYYSSSYKIRDVDQENMIISAAGPGLNLAFAIIFFITANLFPVNSLLWWIGAFGFGVNVGLGAFNMIPFPPLDGFKIFKRSVPVGLALALPLWGIFLYVFFL